MQSYKENILYLCPHILPSLKKRWPIRIAIKFPSLAQMLPLRFSAYSNYLFYCLLMLPLHTSTLIPGAQTDGAPNFPLTLCNRRSSHFLTDEILCLPIVCRLRRPQNSCGSIWRLLIHLIWRCARCMRHMIIVIIARASNWSTNSETIARGDTV